MAQLIKLQDYISRYEWDTLRYPTQYIRMKKENWDHLYERWSNPVLTNSSENLTKVEESSGLFSRLKEKLTKRNVHTETIYEEVYEKQENLPATEKELRKQFLDNLLNFQLKWATSTVTHQSIVDQKYYSDSLLKYLLQRFPDNYFVMYYPVFSIKQAPIEADIIFISPIEIEIIQFVEYEESAVIMAGEERTWHLESPEGNRKILNPLISLKRTERVIKSILATKGISFTIKKTVVSRTNRIIFASEPYLTRILGNEDYNDWFKEKRSLNSPLKNMQIKVAEALLDFCESHSFRRPEWEDEKDDCFNQTDMEES